MTTTQSSDTEIRRAVHTKILRKQHLCEETLVVDELGLSHGKIRVDVATLNGYLHGYEIKSGKDSLNRLPAQLNEYKKSLQKLTIVAAPKHIDKIVSTTPNWCGIIVADRGPRGGITFTVIRQPKLNKEVDVFSMAHLLWRKEAIELLDHLGGSTNISNKPRKALYQEIAQLITITDLVKLVKYLLMSRTDWRVD